MNKKIGYVSAITAALLLVSYYNSSEKKEPVVNETQKESLNVIGSEQKQTKRWLQHQTDDDVTWGSDIPKSGMADMGFAVLQPETEDDTKVNLSFNYQLGAPLSQQIDSTTAQIRRTLADNRYHLVERNNIVLKHRESAQLNLHLPTGLSGFGGERKLINFSFNGKYRLKYIQWDDGALRARGGQIIALSNNSYVVHFPTYSRQQSNHLTISAVAYDEQGNVSNSSEMGILINVPATLSPPVIKPIENDESELRLGTGEGDEVPPLLGDREDEMLEEQSAQGQLGQEQERLEQERLEQEARDAWLGQEQERLEQERLEQEARDAWLRQEQERLEQELLEQERKIQELRDKVLKRREHSDDYNTYQRELEIKKEPEKQVDNGKWTQVAPDLLLNHPLLNQGGDSSIFHTNNENDDEWGNE
ncbi:inverse autotransporter beta domain-containing protein [Photorhabdus cinerea]|uniref:Inverse autotransporter beta-domain domain-containing protein n=1 Tax=Photorhabdus cinerea TaxID=471575 RepID=A0A7X5TGI3_9GAMM|nr:inverse autotransporter beta domain-containing protein [Photorhabdus cinerea]NHB92791.1 hypothetical protein [Photorhabdus cinerea]